MDVKKYDRDMMNKFSDNENKILVYNYRKLDQFISDEIKFVQEKHPEFITKGGIMIRGSIINPLNRGMIHIQHMLHYGMNNAEKLLYRGCKTVEDFIKRAIIVYPLLKNVDPSEHKIITIDEYLSNEMYQYLDPFLVFQNEYEYIRLCDGYHPYLRSAITDIYLTFNDDLK